MEKSEVLHTLWPHLRIAISDDTIQWENLERFLHWWTERLPLITTREWGELRVLWRYFQIALQHEQSSKIFAEDILSWWITLWYQYWGHGETQSAELPEFTGLYEVSTVQLIQLVQELLSVSYGVVEAAQIRRFWHDLIERGAVPESHRHEITELYLIVFGRAIFRGHWRVTIDGLKAVLKTSWHPQAWRACGRFLHNALRRNFFA